MTTLNTSWGNVADWYDRSIERSTDSFQEKVVMPNLLRIVNPKRGMTILDVACGQGHFSRALAKNGAKVIGCDISSELIELAKKGSPKEIEYFVGSADNLSFAGEVDVAIIVLALQNIENLTGTISECAKVLGSNGRLVIVLNHPAFRIPQNSSWEWGNVSVRDRSDASMADHTKKKRLYRRIDSYMSEKTLEIDMTPGKRNVGNKKYTVSFHRPLQTYFKILSKSGFVVARLEEWISHKKSQMGPHAPEEDRMRKEIPMFMCLEARKMFPY